MTDMARGEPRRAIICAAAAARPQLGSDRRYLIKAAIPSTRAIAISNQTAPIAIIIGPEHFIIIIVSSFLFVRPESRTSYGSNQINCGWMAEATAGPSSSSSAARRKRLTPSSL